MPQQKPNKPQPCPRCEGRKKYNNRECALCCGTGTFPPKRRFFETYIHVAGQPFWIDNRVIQRCACCGAKLFDSAASPQKLDAKGKPKNLVTFVAGDFVEVLPRVSDVPERFIMVGHMNTDPPPENFCIELVERASR